MTLKLMSKNVMALLKMQVQIILPKENKVNSTEFYQKVESIQNSHTAALCMVFKPHRLHPSGKLHVFYGNFQNAQFNLKRVSRYACPFPTTALAHRMPLPIRAGT